MRWADRPVATHHQRRGARHRGEAGGTGCRASVRAGRAPHARSGVPPLSEPLRPNRALVDHRQVQLPVPPLLHVRARREAGRDRPRHHDGPGAADRRLRHPGGVADRRRAAGAPRFHGAGGRAFVLPHTDRADLHERQAGGREAARPAGGARDSSRVQHELRRHAGLARLDARRPRRRRRGAGGVRPLPRAGFSHRATSTCCERASARWRRTIARA